MWESSTKLRRCIPEKRLAKYNCFGKCEHQPLYSPFQRLSLGDIMFSLAFASLLALVQTSVAQTSKSAASTEMALNIAAKTAGKLYFGTATDNPELNDTAYFTLLNNTAMFGQLTPGNSLKWVRLHFPQFRVEHLNVCTLSMRSSPSRTSSTSPAVISSFPSRRQQERS